MCQALPAAARILGRYRAARRVEIACPMRRLYELGEKMAETDDISAKKIKAAKASQEAESQTSQTSSDLG